MASFGHNLNTVDKLNCMRAWGLDMIAKAPPITLSVRWLPPPTGFVKVNTDGSEIKGFIQGGAVYRDLMGFVIAAFSRRMGKGQAYEAELTSAIEGITMAIMKGWRKLILEADSMHVVSLFQNQDAAEIPWKFKAVWDWMNEMLCDVEFWATHIYREGNTVADAISTNKMEGNYCWWDEVPNFILQLAAKDRYMEYYRIR